MDVDIEGEKSSNAAPSEVQQNPTAANPSAEAYVGGYGIDICFEASKLPLDVAIFNSARAAGGNDKIRKYLQAVLVIGGTARIPGMTHALESRLVLHIFFTRAKACPCDAFAHRFTAGYKL
jgi:actin-related protein 8